MATRSNPAGRFVETLGHGRGSLCRIPVVRCHEAYDAAQQGGSFPRLVSGGTISVSEIPAALLFVFWPRGKCIFQRGLDASNPVKFLLKTTIPTFNGTAASHSTWVRTMTSSKRDPKKCRSEKPLRNTRRERWGSDTYVSFARRQLTTVTEISSLLVRRGCSGRGT